TGLKRLDHAESAPSVNFPPRQVHISKPRRIFHLRRRIGMKKGILALAVATALIGAAGAQNLGTTSIADGFDTGTRGNEAPGTTPTDGSVFLDYSGADATGTIRYMNAYAGSASPGD